MSLELKNGKVTKCFSVNSKIVNELLPYIVTVVSVFQVPLQFYVFNNIHWIIILLANIYILGEYVIKNRGKVYISRPLIFCAIITVWIAISLIMVPSILISVIGALDYLIFFAFWTLFFACRNNISADFYISFLIFLGLILAILGIYQYFVDYTVFGIASFVSSINTPENAARMSAFRASSIMTSTQEFSMFMGFSIGLCISKWNELKFYEITKWIFLGVLFLGGIVAGGKVVALIAGIPLIIKSWELIKKRFILSKQRVSIVILLLGIFLLFAFLFKDRISHLAKSVYKSFERIFIIFTDFKRFLHQENTRSKSMSNIFSDGFISFILGRGLGTSSYSAYNLLGSRYNFHRTTLESYFLSFGYEMGIIGFINFIYFFYGAIIKAKRKHEELWMLLLGIALSMFFTPTYYSFSMFPISGLFVYIYYRDYYTEDRLIYGKTSH